MDELEVERFALLNNIRYAFAQAHGAVFSWEPAPMPADWVPPRRQLGTPL
jgi:hypothetical protein